MIYIIQRKIKLGRKIENNLKYFILGMESSKWNNYWTPKCWTCHGTATRVTGWPWDCSNTTTTATTTRELVFQQAQDKLDLPNEGGTPQSPEWSTTLHRNKSTPTQLLHYWVPESNIGSWLSLKDTHLTCNAFMTSSSMTIAWMNLQENENHPHFKLSDRLGDHSFLLHGPTSIPLDFPISV